MPPRGPPPASASAIRRRGTFRLLGTMRRRETALADTCHSGGVEAPVLFGLFCRTLDATTWFHRLGNLGDLARAFDRCALGCRTVQPRHGSSCIFGNGADRAHDGSARRMPKRVGGPELR